MKVDKAAAVAVAVAVAVAAAVAAAVAVVATTMVTRTGVPVDLHASATAISHRTEAVEINTDTRTQGRRIKHTETTTQLASAAHRQGSPSKPMMCSRRFTHRDEAPAFADSSISSSSPREYTHLSPFSARALSHTSTRQVLLFFIMNSEEPRVATWLLRHCDASGRNMIDYVIALQLKGSESLVAAYYTRQRCERSLDLSLS
jgi:hypothetical protein